MVRYLYRPARVAAATSVSFFVSPAKILRYKLSTVIACSVAIEWFGS